MELRQQRKDKMQAVGAIMMGAAMVANKELGPAIIKAGKGAGKVAVKAVKMLPKK